MELEKTCTRKVAAQKLRRNSAETKELGAALGWSL